MWTITSEDLDRAKERATQRRAEIEAKYAEALKAVEAELAEIETIERRAGDFAARYPRDETAAVVETEPEPAFEASAMGASEGAHGSRWRLHFGGARGDRDEAATGSLSR